MSNITLELPKTTPGENATSVEVAEANVLKEVSDTMQRIAQLQPEEQQQVTSFAQQIDLHNSEIITRYGETAQQKLETFTNGALEGVVGRDVGEIGDLLAEMSVNIKDFDKDVENGGIFGAFRSVKKKAEIMRVKYTEVAGSLERVKKELLGQRTTLLVDIKMLDEMYQQNLEYYKELTMYILAGKQKLEETRNGELAELKRKAEITGAQEDAFLYSDLKDQCENFEKQLYDLELTRAVCLQTAPQIRLVQKTDEQLARKIQSSVNNTIPIWKQKIAVALAIQHNEDAAKMQKQITDLTSQMMEETARKLHTSTVAAAKESERGIIDIEAIKVSNTELLATIDDVLTIQEEGRKKRAAAEAELRKAEEDLQQKLIGASQRARS